MFEATRLRLDVEGTPAIDGLSFATQNAEAHVIVLGAARALFEATAGIRGVDRGELTVNGVAPRIAVNEHGVAGAPLDPPMPKTWTALEYATWSARLAGHSRGDAEASAKDALTSMKVGDAMHLPLANVAPVVRRAALIAATVATRARVLALEDPTARLDDRDADALAAATLDALGGARLILFAPRASLASPLVSACEEAIVIDGSGVVAQGSPATIAARGRTYSIRLAEAHGPFTDRVRSIGASVIDDGARLTVDLGEALTTRDLFVVASDTGAAILELRSIARAFA